MTTSRLMLVSGSLRAGSTNSALIRTAEAVAPDGVSTVIYEGMNDLPHFNPDDDPADASYELPVAWINASPRPNGAADAHDSLRKILGYIHAEIIEEACAQIPVPRNVVGADGLIEDEAIRAEIAGALERIAEHLG